MNEQANLNTYGYDLADPDEYAAFCYQRQLGWMCHTLPEDRLPHLPLPPRPALQRQNAEIIEISDSSEEETIIDEDDIEIYIDPSIIVEEYK